MNNFHIYKKNDVNFILFVLFFIFLRDVILSSGKNEKEWIYSTSIFFPLMT